MPSPTNNYPSLSPKTRHRVVWPYFVLIFWLAVIVLAFAYKQDIYDWWQLRNYQAPSSIVNLAKSDTMTNYATMLFKINHPKLLEVASFRTECSNKGDNATIVLGCYHGDEDGIYLLSVSDPRLNGVMQVTAAHEMLHAAYDRLSGSEKTKVDAMLLAYYHNDLKNPQIKAEIASYQKTEPGFVVNEMHSTFGTEVANLPKGLADYYTRYFTDREKIVSYANQYEGELLSRRNQVTADDSQLKTLKAQIDSLNTAVSAMYTQISSEQSQLNQLLAGNNISSYNALVLTYNSLVDEYNSDVSQLKSLITNYNGLVDSRNSIAISEDQLYSELKGSYQTIDTTH